MGSYLSRLFPLLFALFLIKKKKKFEIYFIGLLFILVDVFDGEKVSNGEKYAIVKPVNVGLSSENYYSVQSGVVSGNLIVTGRYRVLSKELQHGMKVSFKQDSPSN